MEILFIKKLSSLIVLVGIIVFLTTCEKDNDIPIFTNQGNIGPEGGIVKTSNGASVEIPAGALSNEATVSIEDITDKKRFINNECKIYELKPDGLTFKDSITITLPFNDAFVNLFTADGNYGISIMVFQDSLWTKLKTEVDLDNKLAQVKTTHFSMYRIDNPSEYSDYFFKNKCLSNEGTNPIRVPYYRQDGYTCAFYSLSMLTRYSGYQYKAPCFMSLMDEGDNWDKGFLGFFGTGLCEHDLPILNEKLAQIGIEAEIAQPTWFNVYNLMGYILKQLNTGYPVYVGTIKHGHAFVVTGYNSNGFFINDPGGIFLMEAFNDLDFDIEKWAYTHVSYDQFHNCLKSPWTDCTIVIKSQNEIYSHGVTMNFHERDIEVLTIDDDDYATRVGRLDLDGKYKPNGYSIINTVNPTLGFDGMDYIEIQPRFANTDTTNSAEVLVYCKIDGQDIEDSPILLFDSSSPQHIDIPPCNSSYVEALFKTQLSNLSKGTHILSMIAKSVDSQILYDSWEFEFEIESEYSTDNSDIIFNPNLTYGSVSDIDGNNYKTIQIGTQTWMAENLKTAKYNDGTLIPHVTNYAEWANLTTPAYCWYNNDAVTYKSTYGALYNYYAVQTGKLCPTGWHVPTSAEWGTLFGGQGDYTVAGGKLKEKGTTHWQSPNTGATNESGFTALPGGACDIYGTFVKIGNTGEWWTSSEHYYYHGPYHIYIFSSTDNISSNWTDKESGNSIRCIKD